MFLGTFLFRDAPRRGIRTLALTGRVQLGIGFCAPIVVVVSGRLRRYRGSWIELLDVLKNKQELLRILRNRFFFEVVLILSAGRTVPQQDVGKLRFIEQFDDLRGWIGSRAVVEPR